MRRVSKKRAGQLEQYKEVREQKRRRLQQEGKYNCVFCSKRLPIEAPEDEVKADCHHLKGRDGDLVAEPEFLSFAHHDCHMEYHHGTKEQKWWAPIYLKIIENQWPSLLEEEQRKFQ